MIEKELKADLHHYLRAAREPVLWKLDGLSEHDVRRPLTPTGTNLLGLVKHLSSVELLYFGLVFDRPFAAPPPWFGQDAEPGSDMWATAGESREYIVEAYRQACAHSDETIAALELDATGHVSWWPGERSTPSLHRVLVHVIAECHRHAGHADIVRELVDGAAGLRQDALFLPPGDQRWWEQHRSRVARAAQEAAQS